MTPPRSPSELTGEGALRPAIGVGLGVLLVINATIGTGIFKTPAKVARLSGSMSAALLMWVVGGLIALCGALSLAELAAAMPRAGGIYEYLRRAWGDRVAFVYGWAKLTLLIPSAVGSFAKLTAEAAASLFGWAPDSAREAWVSVALVLLCAIANVVGVRSSAIQQAIVTIAKYLGVAFLGFVGLALTARGAPPPSDAAAPHFNASPTLIGCFGALVSVMWAYDGWADLASLAGETRDPGRTLPRALIAGTIAINHGGVVLRGEGDQKDGTVLKATGTGHRTLIRIGGDSGKTIRQKIRKKPAPSIIAALTSSVASSSRSVPSPKLNSTKE